MAVRFVRTDLSDDARDYRPVAVEPGVPLLDRGNANAKTVFRWLGGLAAEPEWDDDSVNFYVRDDHGGRLEDAVCQPATLDDLRGPLQHDVEQLRERLRRASPETSTERAIHRLLSEGFEDLLQNEERTDHESFCFRYKDVQGRWRLVWCWGFARVDQELASTVICTDPDCSLLFVRRPGQSPKCPSCEALLASKKKKRGPRKRSLLVGLLLFLLGAGLVYWWLNPNRLVATPETWTGPAGSRVSFDIAEKSIFRRQNVTRRAVAVVSDPRVARFDPFGATATATNPGKTVVTFYLGSLSASTTMLVDPPTNPTRIAIEPATVELGIGTTAHLRVVGEYEDGSQVDLSGTAEWAPLNDGVVYAVDGLLEGLDEGSSQVSVRYRATPESDYLTATADVNVAKFAIKSMEMEIDPDPVSVGRASNLRIDVISEAGRNYSVLESSRLAAEVSPSHVATVQGIHVRGAHPGSGRLAATFDDRISAEVPFDVEVGPGLETLVVAPEQLQMIVGEITDLSIASPSSAPIRVTSSDAAVVEIGRSNRLIGRGEGTAQITVAQGSERRTVDATVTREDILSIVVRPARVVVPVDHAAPVRVMGRIEGQRHVELAPDLIEYDKLPSPQYADFDAATMDVRGVQPTTPSNPQNLAARFGAHQASAPVEVVVAPLRFELTPSGKVAVPLGQARHLQGWANYGSGLRVQVFPDRIRWQSDPPSGSTPGLELRDGRAVALKAGAGPLTVWGSYLGQPSNRVTLRSVEAADVNLALEVDRSLRLAGEPGRAMLTGSSSAGDVELVPELAQFKSSDPKTLAIDPVTGRFQAMAPGLVTVTAEHAAAQEPVSRELRVVDPAKAQLAFEPATARLAVDEVAPLRLFLKYKDGDVDLSEPMVGPGVHYSLTRPGAVAWNPPVIEGLSPAPPFGMTASYSPWLDTTATAQVEVLAAAEPTAIRVVPGELSLVPGQAIALRVEEQLPESDQWREVRPGAVDWQVPAALLWTPAADGLCPTVALAPETSGSYAVRAEVRGKQAECRIARDERVETPTVELSVQREPEGRFLPVGHSQRFTILNAWSDKIEPALGVRWQPDFENDYVVWRAPVLTAKRAGHVQWLQADVGGRAVRFYTYTYQPAETAPLPAGDRPVAVRILSDQGSSVQFPVGAEFDDFRVEAEYSDGFVRLVTNKATLRTAEPPQDALLAPSDGRLVGLRPGQTLVHAEFEGVASSQGLGVSVTAEVDVDEIRLTPAPLEMMPGETLTMEAVGYKGGHSVGILTGLGGLTWQSADPQVASANGPAVTAAGLGQTTITARRGDLASQPAEVIVGDRIADDLVVDPKFVQIRVGQAIRVGTDLTVTRGQTDLSQAVTVYPALQNVLRYDAATRSLVGVAPGTTPVSFIWGKKLTDMMVEVTAGGPVEGQIVVEPPAAILAPGQALRPRVFVVTNEGYRIDRTEAASLTSSAPDQVRVSGFRTGDHPDWLFAIAPGAAEITVSLPGAPQPAKVSVTVNNEPITDLVAEPSQLNLVVGDLVPLHVLGSAASGTYDLYPQDQLTLGVGGANAGAVRLVDPNQVEAVAPGQAEMILRYGDQLMRQVPVTVSASQFADLQIDPPRATLHPGQGLVYQVTGTVGGQRRVLGPESGVQLSVREPAIAQVFDGMTVGGTAPGRTGVVATLGNQQAEALLEVTPGADTVPGIGPDGVAGLPERVIDANPDGTVWIDGQRYYHRPGVGWVLVDDDRVVGPGIGEPIATEGVAALRFVPDDLRLAIGSQPATVRVVEVLSDGSEGRDVTAEPGLELTQPPDVAKVELTSAGPAVRAVGTGETRIGARLGTLTAETPLRVTVAGDRFLSVETRPNWGPNDFTVTIEVLSEASEGALEYRVSSDGSPPTETWTPSQEAGDNRKVVLESPRLPYRGEGALFNLVLESRDGPGGIVQRYPFTFRLVRNIERTDDP